MNELLNDLLVSAANDATEINIARTVFDVNILVKSTIFSFEHTLTAKRQSVNFNSNRDELFVDVDKQKLKEVLENLLSNAIKYSEFDSIIRVSVLKNEKNLEIKVQDNGPGLTPEDFKKSSGNFRD